MQVILLKGVIVVITGYCHELLTAANNHPIEVLELSLLFEKQIYPI